MTHILYSLKQKWMLVLLFVVNILGTAYGYIWYGWQLADTPVKFLAFVPDSPTASLFFSLVLLSFLFKKHIPLIEALAAVTLFKYGVWAVGMNVAGGLVSGNLSAANYMLMFSHGGMALEGLLYAAFYRIKPWHLLVAAIWVLHDVVIDYVFGMMPRYPVLAGYENIIGYFTFWLSVLSIFLIYMLTLRTKHKPLKL